VEHNNELVFQPSSPWQQRKNPPHTRIREQFTLLHTLCTWESGSKHDCGVYKCA